MTSLQADLAPIWRELSEGERRVLVEVAKRLRMGLDRYGALDVEGDPRDFRREATEEFLDATVYLAILSLREDQCPPKS